MDLHVPVNVNPTPTPSWGYVGVNSGNLTKFGPEVKTFDLYINFQLCARKLRGQTKIIQTRLC